MKNYDFYKEYVEENLLRFLPAVAPEARTLYDAMAYSVSSGGKRIRPVLLLASCDWAGGDLEEALPYACALEFIHTYSLIHDDLPAMDNDDLRRGRPTCHKASGEDIAILAGDGLLNSAHQILLEEMSRYEGSYEGLLRHARAAAVLSRNAGVQGMIAGQVCDVQNENTDCTIDMLDYIEANKTGALLAAPVQAGLILGGASDDIIADWTIYARCIGRAFQIADDILDATGDADIVGKKTGKDHDLGKCSYVSVQGLDTAREMLHALTEQAVQILSGYGESASFFTELALRLERRNY
ncbi:MAG: polyprenyl synthetase family protein [Mogibacterium sp.]|nr:polyprenyl synthetase family protein [Mogibacterium sp.]